MDSSIGLEEQPGRKIRSFVLRSGRMSAAQRRCYDTLFPIYGMKADIDFPIDDQSICDSQLIFGNQNPLTIEIGFGMGSSTACIAKKNPKINYLGIEVYKPGIGRLLWEIEKSALRNIRIIEGDASEVINRRIADNSVTAFHIFFPDPWPKKRHNKRRLLTRPFTDVLASKLVTGGYIYMVSDWKDYANWALTELTSTPGLVNKYESFAEAQEWRPNTEFEMKGIKKEHEIRELYFEKRQN